MFPGDGKEAGAIGLCGRNEGKTRQKLLVHRLIPVPYEICTRTEDRLVWPVTWLDPLLEEAERRGFSLVKFHSHPTGFPRFSAADDASDKALFAGIHGWIDRDIHHASVVLLPDDHLFGRTVDGFGHFADLEAVAIVGDDLRFSYPVPVDHSHIEVGRPTAAFGKRMVAELRRLSAAVVGASGTGSIVIEQLARLGFGRLVLVDPQIAEIKNQNRIVNARKVDVDKKRPKVEVAKIAIDEMGFGTIVEALPFDVVDRRSVEAVASCDIIFGCVDSAEGRDVLNRIASHYLAPYLDLGVGIVELLDSTIDQINGVVHYLKPGGSSLLSRGAYRPEQVAADAMRRRNPAQYEQLRREKYIEGADEEAPAVISVNMTVAALAVDECLARLYRFRNLPNKNYATLRLSLTNPRSRIYQRVQPVG